MKISLKVLLLAGLILPFLIWAKSASAQTPIATGSFLASPSAKGSASASARVKASKQKEDITQPTKPKNKLEQVLAKQVISQPTWRNFIRYLVQQSVNHGVPINTLVLILLLPLAGAIIATLRHMIGLRGLGIFTPTVLSVAFISTGISVGLIIFSTVVISLTLVRLVLKKIKFRMQYLPRMSLIMIFITLSIIFLFYFLATKTQIDIYTISIFPILIMMLLAESFMEVQIGRSLREAIYLTIQTLLIALLVYWVLTMEWVQVLMISHTEAVVLATILWDIFVGKYVGLRVLEYWRFRRLVSSR